MSNIKQVLVSGATYDIEALHFVTGELDTPEQWKTYIDNLVGQGLQIVIDNKSSTKEEPATTASLATMGKLYMVTLTGQVSGTYTEFVTIDKGSSASPRYVWEKIGTTEADLTNYVKKGTYTAAAQTDGPTETGSAGAETATGTASVTYKKAAAATGSEGDHTHTVTGKITAAGTISTGTGTVNYTPAGSVSQPTFSNGSAATAGAHTHSVTAKGSISVGTGTVNYTPSGSVTHAADSTVSVITGVGADGTGTAVGGITTTAAAKKGVKVTTTACAAADKGTVGISGGTASGSTNVITGYPNFSGGSASGTFVTDVKTAGSASITGYTATATGRVQYVDSVTGGSASGTFNTGAIKSISGTKNYGFSASQATIATTIKTNNYGFATSTSNVMYAPTVTNGVLSWSTKAAGTTLVMNSVAASTQDAHTGDAASTASVSYTAPSVTTKYLGVAHSDPQFNTGNVSWTAASLGTASTASVVTGVTAASLTGTTTFVTNAIKAAALAEDTATTPAFAFNTDAINSATASSTFTALKGVKATGSTNVITAIGALGFSGTGVELKFTGASANTDSKGGHTHTVTGDVSQPTFSGTGVELKFTGSEVNLTSGSAATAGAHTHSISSADETANGSVSVAVSNHTHSIAQHTHNVKLQ